MRDCRIYLKVKIKNLADEARTIKKEENKSKGALRQGLWLHRCGQGPKYGIVRKEARHSLLAYGFIKGMSYDQLEKGSRPFDAKRVLSLIDKFGPVQDHENEESHGEYQCRLNDNRKRAAVWVQEALKQTKQVA
jgi:hypothetical protein